jgi:hypothetical protein
MLTPVSTELHLATNDSVTACGRVYAGKIYSNGQPVMVVCSRVSFAVSILGTTPCGSCKRKYDISRLKVRRAALAYQRRIESGAETEIALRDTRQEFDLSEAEEIEMVGKPQRVLA